MHKCKCSQTIALKCILIVRKTKWKFCSCLCSPLREKFWRVGNKEREGEFGACFLLQGPGGQRGQALLFCARPGSRIWEASFSGEVLSTHQFKQLLACPPLPLVSYKWVFVCLTLTCDLISVCLFCLLVSISIRFALYVWCVFLFSGMSHISTLHRRVHSLWLSQDSCSLGSHSLYFNITRPLVKTQYFTPAIMTMMITSQVRKVFGLIFSLWIVCVFLSDQNLLTWTDSAIYIFTPHSGQVLLWTEVKGERSLFNLYEVLSMKLYNAQKYIYSKKLIDTQIDVKYKC